MLGASKWRTGLLAGSAAVMLSVSAFAATGDDGAEDRYRELEPLPTTASDVDDVAPTAVALVDALGGVPVSDDPPATCPREQLEVSWEEPVGFEQGAYVGEIGPPPTEATSEVVGIVVCEGSTFAFKGFEAVQQDDGTWTLSVIPAFPDESDDIGRAEQRSMDLMARNLPDQEVGIEDLGELEPLDLGPIDPYAPYEPQRLCHPDPKRGAVALAQLLLEYYPGTRNLGIGRDCDVGPRSEHKEGRAFDWGARVLDAEERADVDDFLSRLLATDDAGNRHALARRLGVMYVIWNGQIWASHRADEGWRPYNGPSTHVDHVHISLSWDGALGRTSLWREALPSGWWAAFPTLAATPPAGVLVVGSDTTEEAGTEHEALFFRASPSDRAASTTQRDDSNDGPTQQDGGTQDEDGTSSDDEPTTTDTVSDTVEETQDTVDETQDTVDETEETLDDTTDELTDPLSTEDATEPLETESPSLP